MARSSPAPAKRSPDAAASDVRVLVVGNPCNTNCLIAMNNAPNVPNDRWYAMTMLDQNRAVSQLAQKSGKSVSDISNMTIWGNHSATQYPDFYNAKIGGQPAADVIGDEAWLQGEFITTVQKRGAAIIQARGASSAASAANAIIDKRQGHRESNCSRSNVQCGSLQRRQLRRRRRPDQQLSSHQRRTELVDRSGPEPQRVRSGEDRRHRRGAEGRT